MRERRSEEDGEARATCRQDFRLERGTGSRATGAKCCSWRLHDGRGGRRPDCDVRRHHEKAKWDAAEAAAEQRAAEARAAAEGEIAAENPGAAASGAGRGVAAIVHARRLRHDRDDLEAQCAALAGARRVVSRCV
jgi:hypothetical protein